MTISHKILFCVLFFSMSIIGCGSGNPLGRKAVSGTVTFAGKQLPSGTISFEPLESDGVASGAAITDGKYQIASEGGLPNGSYRVRINSPEPGQQISADQPPGTPEPPSVERIPAEYNVNSEEIIEVTDGNNEFNFTIPAK